MDDTVGSSCKEEKRMKPTYDSERMELFSIRRNSYIFPSVL
jgi:hypothetical protein